MSSSCWMLKKDNFLCILLLLNAEKDNFLWPRLKFVIKKRKFFFKNVWYIKNKV